MKSCNISLNENQTRKIAEEFAKKLLPGDVVFLYGDLGAGKTCFVKGIAKGLEINPDQVSSPTFIILNEYSCGRIPLYHFDFYRINTASEIDNIGFYDYINSSGISVIEWPERIEEAFDQPVYKVTIKNLEKIKEKYLF